MLKSEGLTCGNTGAVGLQCDASEAGKVLATGWSR